MICLRSEIKDLVETIPLLILSRYLSRLLVPSMRSSSRMHLYNLQIIIIRVKLLAA